MLVDCNGSQSPPLPQTQLETCPAYPQIIIWVINMPETCQANCVPLTTLASVWSKYTRTEMPQLCTEAGKLCNTVVELSEQV